MFRGLTDEDQARQRVVRQMVEQHFRPLEGAIDRDDDAPASSLRGLRKQAHNIGAMGFNLPERLGGAGLNYLSQALLGVEMGRVTTVLGEQVGYLPDSLCYVDQAQQKWLLDPLLTGEHTIAYALTEAGGGSNLAAARTRAEASNGGWVISGAKHFISNAGSANHVLVLAVTNADSPLRERFTVFVVPHDAEGFHVVERYRTMGWHGHHLNALSFEDCFVPNTQVLGEIGQGFEVIMSTINGARLNIASRCLGAADLALSEGVQFAHDRQIGDQRLAELGITQQKLADMDVDVQAAALLIAEAAAQGDEGSADFRVSVARAKLYASEMAGRVADTALQILGGAGYTSDYPVERILRDVRAFRIGEGTSEVQRIQIARALTKRQTSTS